MKLNKFILFFSFSLVSFFISSTSIFAELVIRKIDSTNSPMVTAIPNYMFYDNDRTIWIKEDFGLYYIKQNQDSVINILYDSTGRKYELYNLNGYPYFDNHGNIIFVRSRNIIVFDTATKKITQNFDASENGEYRALIFSKGGFFIDNRFYLKTSMLFLPQIYFLEYDISLKKWTFDRENIIYLPDNLRPHTMYMYQRQNKLHIPCDSGMFSFGRDRYTYGNMLGLTYNSFKGFEKLYQRWVIYGGCETDLSQQIATYAFLIDRRATIMRVYGDDSVKTYTLPYKLAEALELDTNMEKLWGIKPEITAVNKLKTEFLMGFPLTFIFWSEKEGFKYIPRPPHEIIDTNDWLTKISLFLKDKDELWMGTWGGIYVLNLHELLATRTDDFPYKTASNSESEVESYTQIGIYNISPTPCTDYLDLEYFLLSGFEELNIRIYDTSGKEYINPSYDILNQDGIFRKIRVNFGHSSLSPGMYLIKLEENGKSCSKKFIVQ